MRFKVADVELSRGAHCVREVGPLFCFVSLLNDVDAWFSGTQLHILVPNEESRWR